MSRRHKGPPKENIDGILQAMSHKADIDSETLSYYFDRLDEEWTNGARDKVLQLLRKNDTKAQTAAMQILAELATDFDLEEIEDFVADPTVGDLAKLTLVPVLSRLGSEMSDEGILDYLNDPEAAMLQMQVRLLDLMNESEMGVEAVLEDVLTMPMERRLGFINWLGASQDPRALKLLLPLLENRSNKVVSTTIDALVQLGPITASQAIPALNYLIANTSNRQLKYHAREALDQLQMFVIPGQEITATGQTEPEPLYEVRASFIDGSGTQIVMLSWKCSNGLLKGVHVLFQDTWGIKDCYGVDEMEVERWSEIVADMKEQGLGSYKVSLDYCRALVADARAMNKRTRHKLPVAYAIWRPLIEGVEPPTIDSRAKVALEPVALTADIVQLVNRGDELLSLKEFEPWTFDPFDPIKPYINPYLNAADKLNSSRARKSKKEPKATPETIVSEVLDKVVEDSWRLLYSSRLRRQGALFKEVGRGEDALLVSAVCSALDPGSELVPSEQPFLRALMHRSLANGLLRMMAEAIEGLKLNSSDTDDDFYF
jgi:hypothetical protein